MMKYSMQLAMYDPQLNHSEKIRVLSTFSGISAAGAAWHHQDYEFVGYCEPEPFQCHVLHHRRGASRPKYLPEGFTPTDYQTLPEDGVPNFGDIVKISDDDLRALGRVDVLEGGSPCQGFSVAGMRRGLEDPRSNLLLAFCQLANRMRKINGLRFVVWENVHGILGKRDTSNGFGSFLGALSGAGCALQPPRRGWSDAGHVLGSDDSQIAWRTIDAQHWGLAQRRKRVFAVASFGARDGLGDPCEILFEREGYSRHSTPSAREVVVPTFRGSRGIEFRSEWERRQEPDVQKRLKQLALYRIRAEGRDLDGDIDVVQVGLPIDDDTPVEDIIPYGDASLVDIEDVKAHIVMFPPVVGTLSHSAAGLSRPAGQGNELDFVIVTKSSEDAENWIVRRPTPLEAERLQGFPDYWTDVPFKGKLPSDTVRYQALGNSMPVPFMEFLGQQISRHFRVMLKHEKAERGDPSKAPVRHPTRQRLGKGGARRFAFIED
jgi:DNA (cytosine-5)-methyltransferase 1